MADCMIGITGDKTRLWRFGHAALTSTVEGEDQPHVFQQLVFMPHGVLTFSPRSSDCGPRSRHTGLN
jgi:hypothetical protein